MNLEKSSQGKSDPNFEPNLYKSFNRGFTNFFADGKRKNICTLNYSKSLGEYIGKVTNTGKNFITVDGKKLNNGDGICFFDENNELCGIQVQKVQDKRIFVQLAKSIKNL